MRPHANDGGPEGLCDPSVVSTRPPDVPRVADWADIANLKLMKCGGLRET